MREKQQKQMPLMEPASNHPQERELEVISKIIDATPSICACVLQDLNRGKLFTHRTGARGMSADQILRATIIMRILSSPMKNWPFIFQIPGA